MQEIEMEFGHKPALMEKARADAEDFLSRVRKGLIKESPSVTARLCR